MYQEDKGTKVNLVIGRGLIGRNLYSRLRKVSECEIVGRECVDLLDGIWDLPESDVVYMTAAETSTQESEKFPKETQLINVTNTVRLCSELVKKAKVVWISSERVFDGSEPYRRLTDEVCPTTEYGRQKAEAEKQLLEIGVGVIRFSKVLGNEAPLFDGWLEKFRKGEIVEAFWDMSMSPIPVRTAVDALLLVDTGLYQLSGEYDISYDRIARHIANYLGQGEVKPVASGQAHPFTTLESNLDIEIPDVWETIYGWCRDKNLLPTRTR